MAVNDKLRCVQCDVTETPLWRSGPAGPKTLCNACGVRYKKTGRLLTSREIAKTRKQKPPSSKSKGKNASVSQATTTDQSQTKQRSGNAASSSKESPSSSSESSAEPVYVPSSVGRTQMSPILEDYIRSTPTSGICVPIADVTNYQCIFSGLMVVQRPSRRKVKKLSVSLGSD